MLDVFVAVPLGFFGGREGTGAALLEELVNPLLELFRGTKVEDLSRVGQRCEQLQDWGSARKTRIGGELAQSEFKDFADLALPSG